MNTIFILTVGETAKQVVYEREARKNLVAHYVVKFLSNAQLTPKQVEDCVKKKKPQFVVFDNVPELTVRTLVNHLQKKFRNTLRYYSTSPSTIEHVVYIKTVDEVIEVEKMLVQETVMETA